MAKQQKCEDCAEIPSWLTTFGDLMALLLTFFVLLLSMSTTKKEDFQNAMGSIQGALGLLEGEPILTSPVKMHVPNIKGDEIEDRPSLSEALKAIMEDVDAEGQPEKVEVIQGTKGLTIRIPDNALFASGKADLKPEMLSKLGLIGGALATLKNEITIEGHTDNRPINNEEFKNNHWLSNARALEVLDLFINEVGIDPGRLSAVGHGEFKPVDPNADNDLPENRAKNRRVEIKVNYETDKDGQAPDDLMRLMDKIGLGTQD